MATEVTASPAAKLDVSRGFVATAEVYEQLYAYGQAMGWLEKPFEFVLQNWLASRAT